MEFLKYGIGWLIGIAAAVASAYYFFYNKRLKSLQIESSLKSMIVAGVGHHGQLTVAYDGTKVRDPYFVEVAVVNSGHKDITSKDFDADKPLRISVRAKVVAPLQSSELVDAQPAAMRLDVEAGEVVVGPSKLAVGEVHQLRLLVDGYPKIAIVDNPLIDTKIEFGERIKDQKVNRILTAAFLGFTLLVVLQISSSLFNNFEDEMNVVSVDFAGSSRVASPWGAAFWAWANTLLVLGILLLLAYAAFGGIRMYLSSRRRTTREA
ncbi:hypothetical protein [Williamsia sp. R60]